MPHWRENDWFLSRWSTACERRPSAVTSRRLPRCFTLSMGFWAEPPNRIWLLCIFLVPRHWPWLCRHHRVHTLSTIVLHMLVVLTKCLWWRKLFEENRIMQEIIWAVLIYLINTSFILYKLFHRINVNNSSLVS